MRISKRLWNKKIDVYEYGKTVDEYGVSRKGYTKIIENMKCNIQPESSEKAEKEYGYKVECTNKVFCNVEPLIKESSIIMWNNQTYEVKQIIRWNDYWILLIYEKGVSI